MHFIQDIPSSGILEIQAHGGPPTCEIRVKSDNFSLLILWVFFFSTVPFIGFLMTRVFWKLDFSEIFGKIQIFWKLGISEQMN